MFDKHLKLHKRYCCVNTLLRTFINIFVTIIFNSKKFKLWEANIVSEIINGVLLTKKHCEEKRYQLPAELTKDLITNLTRNNK